MARAQIDFMELNKLIRLKDNKAYNNRKVAGSAGIPVSVP